VFFLLRLIINAVALLITAWVIPGIHLGAAGPHPTTTEPAWNSYLPTVPAHVGWLRAVTPEET